MARIDGVHGPEKKRKIAFIDEWTPLKNALGVLRYQLSDSVPFESIPVAPSTVEDIVHYVPMLMDAYSELWELMEGVIKAREQQEESKNDLYVPDAQELVQGLANPERTRK